MGSIFLAGRLPIHANNSENQANRLHCEGTFASLPDNPRTHAQMKRVRYINGALDALDTALLRALAEDARLPLRDLAQKIGLSAPSTTERLRRLEDAGVIEGYAVRVNATALGLSIGAYLRIRPMPGELDRVASMLAAEPQVIACDRITGDDCFIAKALVPDMAALETLINGLLPYATTNTSIVVSTPVAPRLPNVG
jgi:Lrp/AsnC family leucine-responsive transcriptional regulator